MLTFVHIQKTAGTTLKFILRNSFGFNHCDTAKIKNYPFNQEDLNFAKRVFPKIKSIAGHNIVEPTKNLDETDYILTILRDPVKRCASHYQDECLRGGNTLPFEEWIKNPYFQNMQVKQIAGEPDAKKAIELVKNRYFFVGLTEKFDESLKLLKLISPYQLKMKYRRKIVASSNSIKDELIKSEQNRKLVEKYNDLDMELYNYVFNELYPERIAAYKDQILNTEIEGERYKSSRVLNYQLAVGFNKFIFRQFVKLKY
jgi:hypothetical protein